MTQFSDFFAALWKSEKWPNPEPFPWQRMLAEQIAAGGWPEAIALPTASGKTTCLDIAVYTLATAARGSERPMPRRIWFVVDRRIVVDEAYERAREIARRLFEAREEPVKAVADRLRELSGTGRPLAVARLRGGAWRDDGWARVPSQPAIICSTVDQIGSALLFRAYGHSDNTASIFAGLAAHDSLILLDEAQCAVPFLQTLRAIARFRSEPWAEAPLTAPFQFSIMSATPPSDIAAGWVFPQSAERPAALNHPLLQDRVTAKKLAKLVSVKTKAEDDDPFAVEAVSPAADYVRGGRLRVAVMVNRVATAARIADRLRNELADAADVVLLTGRMRPLDRDVIIGRWMPLLKAGSTISPRKPAVVVTTQCLEVGADFSFDALVTECASLDALRQRFGRLDRLGKIRESPAAILVRESDVADDAVDPIYGKAVVETWRWLHEAASDGTVNFGIAAMDTLVEHLRKRDEDRFRRLLFPSPDAPVLLPAHLDLLCQTSPRPTPEPDIALFLHGKERGRPEVQILFRADLPDPTSEAGAENIWINSLSLVAPTSPEMWTVPLHRLRRWLIAASDDVSGDVEGTLDEQQEEAGELDRARCCFVLWHGRDRSEMTSNVRRIKPGDIVVLRATDEDFCGLAQVLEPPDGIGPARLDLAERAQRTGRGRVVLRLQQTLLSGLPGASALSHILELANSLEVDSDEITTALQKVLDESKAAADNTEEAASLALPAWLLETIQLLLEDGFRIERYPAGGMILVGKKQRPVTEETELELQADEDDLRSRWQGEVTLRQHTADVHHVVSEFSAKCLPTQFGEPFTKAAQSHDLGKLDYRFQVLLQDGSEISALTEPLAKSAALPEGHWRRRQISEDALLPAGFRHEFLSLQLAESFGLVPQDGSARDMALHLIASHHGYARPLAPVVIDQLVETGNAGDLDLRSLGVDSTLTAAERKSLTPAHRLDSGVPERFWRLTRRFGWWGLAYLETVFRLADWEASRNPQSAPVATVRISPLRTSQRSNGSSVLKLDALDGANPLAFLAALGAMRVSSRLFPQIHLRMSWEQRLGAWRPVLWATEPLNEEPLVEALHKNGLKLHTMFSPQLLSASEAASPKNKKGEARWKDKLLFPISAFREFCISASQSPSAAAEFAATWAGETVTTGEEGGELARRTRFDFTAGQQALIRMVHELRKSCTSADLRRSLFAGWRYSATAISLRWDTQDEKRQYALQAVDPTNGSKNPPVADPGANFLAVEGLPLFPFAPDRRANQPGFDRDSDGRTWHWPIWTHPLGLDAIRSLLTLPLADLEEWPAYRRRALGVPIVFQSAIVQPSGRYRCFTPARSL